MAFDDTATVSGSVVSIENGADEVGAKSCVVTVHPTLSGVSSVTETQTGLQIADFENNLNSSSYGCTIEKLSGGGIRFHGTTTQTYLNLTSLFDCEIKSGVSITLSRATARPYRVYVYLKFEDNTTANVIINQNASSVTYTTPKKVIQIRLDASGLTASTEYDESIYVVLQYGSTAHDYEPYTAPTTYSANLGRTVHGAEVDLVSGAGKETCSLPTLLNSLTWTKTTIGGHDCFFANLPNGYIGSGSSYVDGICDGYDVTLDGQMGTDKTIRFYYNESFNFSRCSIRDDRYANLSASEFKAVVDGDIVYQLAESARTDFTFDGQEIPTRLGYNAFWSEQGDTELTYYKDGYGFTSVTIHKETPNGEPVVQTAKFHRIVYGGQADVVKGTCEPKNLLANLGTFPYTISASEQYYTEFSNYIQARQIPLFALENDVAYTLSFDVQCSNEPFNISVGVGDGRYLRDLGNATNLTSGRVSITFTPTGLTEGNNYFAFRAPRYGSKKDYDATVDNVQLEKASSASEYAPYFDPFTFLPISIETDEGENTLFANEGDSAITYRKAVD